MYLGDFTAGKTISKRFNTRGTDLTPITLAGSPVAKVYKSGSTTESTAGVTLTVDYDSVTGLHNVVVDTSADGTFYAAGNDFDLVLTAGTVDSVSVVGTVLATFSLANRSADVNLVEVNGETFFDSDFTILSADGSSVTLPAAYTNGDALPDDDRYVNCSIEVVDGTGAGQVVALKVSASIVARTYDVVAGTMPVTLDNTSKCVVIGPTSLARLGTPTGASIAADVATKQATFTTSTGVTLPATVASPTNITGGVITTVTNLTNAPTAGDFTAAMKTSLDNSTPASVGSVGTVNAMAANSITAAAIATDALGSLELSAGAANEVALAVLDMALVGHTTAGTVGGVLGSLTFTVANVLDVNVLRFAGTVAVVSGGRPEVNTTLIKGSGLGPSVGYNFNYFFDNDGVNTTTTFLDSTNAAATWNLPTSGHTASGTFGAAMNAAGGTGDPWATVLPGAYGAGTAGRLVGDNVNASVAAVKSKTDNLPTDPADASDVAGAFATVNTTLGTLAGYVDTEVAAIKAKTDNLPSNPAASGDAMALTTSERGTMAAALLDLTNGIETGLTPRGAFRLVVAALAGKLSGGGTATNTIRNAVADSKARITATVDSSGNRTAITWDAS